MQAEGLRVQSRASPKQKISLLQTSFHFSPFLSLFQLFSPLSCLRLTCFSLFVPVSFSFHLYHCSIRHAQSHNQLKQRQKKKCFSLGSDKHTKDIFIPVPYKVTPNLKFASDSTQKKDSIFLSSLQVSQLRHLISPGSLCDSEVLSGYPLLLNAAPS